MTSARLAAFVMVARLGSVTEAGAALGVTPSAVSQALRSLRRDLRDELITPVDGSMRLTEAGRRLLPVATQILSLGRDAVDAVRQAHGAVEQLRVLADPLLVEFGGPALVAAFGDRSNDVEASLAGASPSHLHALLLDRSADVALGPLIVDAEVCSEPILRFEQVIVASPGRRQPRTQPERWLVGPSSNDPQSTIGTVIAALGVHDDRVRVFASQAAAWQAVARGDGLSSAPQHLVRAELDAGRLTPVPIRPVPNEHRWYVSTLVDGRCGPAASRFRQFLHSPAATRALLRPNEGVAPSRFRPPVHVTIWSRDLV